jgi:hypothetical protein
MPDKDAAAVKQADNASVLANAMLCGVSLFYDYFLLFLFFFLKENTPAVKLTWRRLAVSGVF